MSILSDRITIIGSGTIGLSFAALHLKNVATTVTLWDTRPDLEEYVKKTLPTYLADASEVHRVRLAKSLQDAVIDATIVQEAGPENVAFKQGLWPSVEKYCLPDALLWSSTSGIPASLQSARMKRPSRLLVVHPYNPPHLMPLLEVVPGKEVDEELVKRTLAYWNALGRTPVVVKKECTGFVANRLAFALLREAIHIVQEGVVTVEELDRVVETSMGPRWSVWGPFKSYHAGGGKGGLESFFDKIGDTVQDCWSSQGAVNRGDGWEKQVFGQSQQAYGEPDVAQRDRLTRKLLAVLEEEKLLQQR